DHPRHPGPRRGRPSRRPWRRSAAGRARGRCDGGDPAVGPAPRRLDAGPDRRHRPPPRAAGGAAGQVRHRDGRQHRGRDRRAHGAAGGEAPGHGRPAGRDRSRAHARHPGRLAGRRRGHRLDRGAAARRYARRPGDAEHPGPGGRGDGGDLARLLDHAGAPRAGHRDPVRDRPGRRRAGALPGRRHRDLRLRPGVPVLRRRGHDRGRGAPRPASRHRHRAGGADHAGVGQAAAGDGRAPHRAAGARHLTRRHHRRGHPSARGPQGARGLPQCHRGRPGPQPRPGRGLPAPRGHRM
ncbi:MAG: Pyrroline-5-carboxylate reductase, partial [uncultured Friedmanniella sp.]